MEKYAILLGYFNKQIHLINRLHNEIVKVDNSIYENRYLLLDKIRSFKHFIRHAYDCELEENELNNIQKKIQSNFLSFTKDLTKFQTFVQKLS